VSDWNKKDDDIRKAVVRICPACGVVNPSGPSRECPHVQLIRFDGVDEDLERLLDQVAVARREYTDLVKRLKAAVLLAAKEGTAMVETTRKASSGEIDRLPSQGDRGALQLTPPSAPRPDAPEKKPRKRRRKGPPTVDPRQLDLLALSPPKGDA
jgi:hypothetical protein